MSTENKALAVQVILTLATIYLGYLGYKITNDQKNIIEVQTYGRPPTISHAVTQHTEEIKNSQVEEESGAEKTQKKNEEFSEVISFRFNVHNNRTYPITFKHLTLKLDNYHKVETCSEPTKVSAEKGFYFLSKCTIETSIDEKRVYSLDLKSRKTFPNPYSKSNFDGVASVIYYDPMEDKVSSKDVKISLGE